MSDTDKLSIISLGGRGEVGKNMIVIEYKEQIIILDAGNLFPEDDKTGIELIIPDLSYLKEHEDKILGVIFSHGHEDHIGAVPYLLQVINPPLYGTDLTMALIESRLEDNGLLEKAKLNTIGSESKTELLKLGPFEIEFCPVNHSIPAAVAMCIKTPAANIVYTGDYKFDQTPVDSPRTDYQTLVKWGENGVLALLGDSTNSEHEGHTLSEMVVARNLEESFRLIEQRIIIATFSSNIIRIQQIFKAAVKTGRKIAVSGYSMLKTIEMACRLGYIDIPEGSVLSIDEASKMDPGKVVLLMTGSQGEYRASLSRLARGEHREVSIIPGDTVYLSASAIPGNELAISETINLLYSKGATVIDDNKLDIHASGHACQEEIKMMINLIRPKFLIPVHGEFRHLYHHAQLGRQTGIPVENIFIMLNGDRLLLSEKKAEIKGKIEAGVTYIERGNILEEGKTILKERRKLARSGFVNIIIPITAKGDLKGEPVFLSRGFTNHRELSTFIKESKKRIVKSLDNSKHRENFEMLERELSNTLTNYFFEKTGRTPLLTVKIKELYNQ